QLSGYHLLPDRHRWCASENVIRPNQQAEKNRITLVLHMSADYLSEDIVEQFHNWSGPISLSIVLNDRTQFVCAERFMRSLIARHSFNNVQVHFLYQVRTLATTVSLFIH
ncbi:hypothetical protein PMAYCL1PPCAC_14099, partial [Pristionchus mayeri]